MTTPLVKGMPVISLADGSTLGVIDHVYVDPARVTVVGFTFHQSGGLFGGGSSGLVDIDDVHAFGPDAVTIPDVSVVRGDAAIESRRGELLELERLLKRTVMTEGGVLVGEVRAIQFGDASYRLMALDVEEAGSHEHVRIDVDEIETIGEELIIIADRTRGRRAKTVRPERALQLVPSRSTRSGEARRQHERRAIGA